MGSTEPSMLDDLGEPELRSERDFLLASLADLDAELEAGDIDEHDYIALKDGYTSRAAAVLRALERRVDGPARPVPAVGSPAGERRSPSDRSARRSGTSPSRPARRSSWRRIAVASGVAAFAVLAGILVARGSGERLPGAPPSGTIATGAQADAQAAQAAVNKGDYAGAIRLYEKIVRQDPGNVEALANRGWLLSLVGAAGKDPSLVDRGLASVRAAEAADPMYPDAHFFAGEILLKDKSDGQGAAREFCLFLSNHPAPAFVPLVNGEFQSALAMAKSLPASAGKIPPCAAANPATSTTAAPSPTIR